MLLLSRCLLVAVLCQFFRPAVQHASYAALIRFLRSRRVGCYEDKGGDGRDIPYRLDMGSKTTQQACLKHCSEKSFSYAAVQAANWCHCGDTYGRYRKVNDKECNLKCAGDHIQTCGGAWRNEVFITKFADGQRIGCYKDSRPRDLPELSDLGKFATQQLCIKRCKAKGFVYAAVQFRSYCPCGNMYGRYGKVSDSECKMPCSGDMHQTCGGDNRNEIFSTKITAKHRLGCFKGKKKNEDLPHVSHFPKRATPHFCIMYCKDSRYAYAGTQKGSYCLCGRTYGRYGKAKDSTCNIKCAGDPTQTCGGDMNIEIFNAYNASGTSRSLVWVPRQPLAQ